MKKAFLFLLSVIAVSLSYGAVEAPRDTKGDTLNTIDWVGALPCRIDSSTGTNAVLCGSANTRNVVYGVIVTSVTATNFIVLRDTNTANTSSTKALSLLADNEHEDEGVATSMMVKFPVPMLFTNGISINASVAPAGEGSWTILYRPLKATE